MTTVNRSKVTLLEIIVPSFYILAQYQIANISLGTILAFTVLMINIVNKKVLNFYKPIFILTGYMLAHDILKLIFCMNSSFPINTWIERIIFIGFLACCINQINEENLYKVWCIWGYVAMAGLIYHAILVYGLGQNVQMIRILPFTSDSISFINAYTRPRSIFLEPAAYVTWILPLLYMTLKRYKYILAAVITITILLSTSTTGLVMSIVLWGVYLFKSDNINRKKKIALIILVAIVTVLFIKLPIFQATIFKASNTDFSSNLRITSGFEIYKDADLSVQLFGISQGSTEQYFREDVADLSKYNMSSNAHWLGFVNALARALLTYGILGGILYIYIFYRLFRSGSKEVYPYLLICFLSIFGQSVFFNLFFVMQFAVLLGINDIKKNDIIGMRIR